MKGDQVDDHHSETNHVSSPIKVNRFPSPIKVSMVPKNERNIRHWFDPKSSDIKVNDISKKEREKTENKSPKKRNFSVFFEKTSSNHSQSWVCTFCTFENHCDLSTCEICENLKVL